MCKVVPFRVCLEGLGKTVNICHAVSQPTTEIPISRTQSRCANRLTITVCEPRAYSRIRFCNSWYILFATHDLSWMTCAHDIALMYYLKGQNLQNCSYELPITMKLSHYWISVSRNRISILKRFHYLFLSKNYFHLHIVRYCNRGQYNTIHINITSRNSSHQQPAPP